MTRPPTNNYNNDLSAFDQTSPLPASTMTMNNINDVLQKIKEQVEAGNLRGAAAQVRELYIMIVTLGNQTVAAEALPSPCLLTLLLMLPPRLMVLLLRPKRRIRFLLRVRKCKQQLKSFICTVATVD